MFIFNTPAGIKKKRKEDVNTVCCVYNQIFEKGTLFNNSYFTLRMRTDEKSKALILSALILIWYREWTLKGNNLFVNK